MRWVTLDGEHSILIGVATNGAKSLVIRRLDGGRMDSALVGAGRQIGFCLSGSGMGIFRQGARFDIKEMRSVFPSAEPSDIDASSVYIRVGGRFRRIRRDVLWAKAMLPIGVNRHGQSVNESVTGVRVIAGSDGVPYVEEGELGAVFLRASGGDESHLVPAFAKMVRGGLSFSRFRRLCAAATGARGKLPEDSEFVRMMSDRIQGDVIDSWRFDDAVVFDHVVSEVELPAGCGDEAERLCRAALDAVILLLDEGFKVIVLSRENDMHEMERAAARHLGRRSPFDMMFQWIEDAGYETADAHARGWRLRVDESGVIYREATKKSGGREVIDRFDVGELDVIAVPEALITSDLLHARWATRDSRRRALVRIGAMDMPEVLIEPEWSETETAVPPLLFSVLRKGD